MFGLLNDTGASAASWKSAADQSTRTQGRKLALFLFDPDPVAKLNEVVSKLSDVMTSNQVGREDEEERKEVTPFKNWADVSRMVVDSTPVP